MIGWDDVRFVLAIQRFGSLSAAARALSVNQTTVGRRLALLEESLQTRIFSHDGQRYQLTRAGQRMLPHVERMETEALALERGRVPLQFAVHFGRPSHGRGFSVSRPQRRRPGALRRYTIRRMIISTTAIASSTITAIAPGTRPGFGRVAILHLPRAGDAARSSIHDVREID